MGEETLSRTERIFNNYLCLTEDYIGILGFGQDFSAFGF